MAVSWKNKHKTRTNIYNSALTSQQTILEAGTEEGHKNYRGLEHLHYKKMLQAEAVQRGNRKAPSWETLPLKGWPFNT